MMVIIVIATNLATVETATNLGCERWLGYYEDPPVIPNVILASDALCFQLEKLYPKRVRRNIEPKCQRFSQAFRLPGYRREPRIITVREE